MSEAGQMNKLKMDGSYQEHLAGRQQRGRIWGGFFFVSNFIGLLVLIVLVLHVFNSTVGLVVLRNSVDSQTLSQRPLDELSDDEFFGLLVEQLGGRARVVIRDRLSVVPPSDFTIVPLAEALAGARLPESLQELTINELSADQIREVLMLNLSRSDANDIMTDQVIKPTVIRTWPLLESVLNREQIESIVAEDYPDDQLEFRSWLSWDFITSSVSSSATTAGLRTSLLGSIWIVSITGIASLIIGVGAAIYLEEYATDNWLTRLIEINIRNLAAIPSIIYGMLGLAVFGFALATITGGYLFGQNLPTQSGEQIVGSIQAVLGEETLTGDARNDLRESLVIARSDQDQTVQIMADAITSNTLESGEKEALIRLFLSYRLPSVETLGWFSTPSIEQAHFDLQDIVRGKLSSDQLDGLAESLRSYGTFNTNGRTVLSAGLTLALLILPLIIVNAQEALRAVPSSIREASYGLGATRWQTTSRQVLPAALPGIMTGVILAVSRAIGETAPLLVVGASTFIGIDPNGFFSKFTVIPIQIYQWTSRPEQEFRAVAAAAIIALLVLMLSLNALAIFIRNRFSIQY